MECSWFTILFSGSFVGNGKKIPIKIEYINRIGAATCILVSDFGNINQIDKVKKLYLELI